MEAAAAQATTPPQVRGANPASRPAAPPRRASHTENPGSGRRPTALSPPEPSAPVLQHPGPGPGLAPRPSLEPVRSTSKPPGPRLPAVRPPPGSPKAAFTSPHVSAAVPEQQLCQTPESHPPPRALRPGPSRSLRRRRSPGRAEGTGRRERAGEGRGPHGRKRRGRGRTEEEATGGSARARPLGAACALPRTEAPSLPKAAAARARPQARLTRLGPPKAPSTNLGRGQRASRNSGGARGPAARVLVPAIHPQR